jgi:hypothetical protein
MSCRCTVGESALELMRRRAGLKPIPSLCDDLDAMMGGGIPVGQITEFCQRTKNDMQRTDMPCVYDAHSACCCSSAVG